MKTIHQYSASLTASVGAALLMALPMPGVSQIGIPSTVSATDGDWSIAVSPGDSSGLFSWSYQSQFDHLFQQWFWFREGGTLGGFSVPEQPLDSLVLMDAFNPAANQMQLNYGDASQGDPIEVDVLYELSGPSANSSTIFETVTIKNVAGRLLELEWFEYTDLDLDNSAFGDSGQLVSANTINQFTPTGTSVDVRVTGGPNPNDYALEEYSILVDSLEDNVETDLATFNKGPLFGVDVTHAFQWGLTLNPGEEITISKEKAGIFGEISGTTQFDPFVVPPGDDGSFTFFNAESGFWWDPPFTNAYDYEILSPGSLFTQVGLPTGINPVGELFEIIVNNAVVGTVAGGDLFDFSGLPGGGVDAFQVANINPPGGVDSALADAFPTQLFFNQTFNNFQMSPVLPSAPPTVPTPSTLALAGLGLLVWRVRRRRLN